MSQDKAIPATSQSERVYFTVTEYKGLNPNPIGGTSFKALLERMAQEVTISSEVRQQQRDAVLALRKLKTTDREAYDKEKSKLNGFCPGLWKRRADDEARHYSPFLVLEFDGVPPGHLPGLIAELRGDPYVMAAFYSPGGDGLRCVVEADCEHQAHRVAYAQILRYLGKKTGIPIGRDNDTGAGHLDPSTCNPSRHFYYVVGLTPDEMHLNPESLVFHVENPPEEAPPPTPTIVPPHPAKAPQNQVEGGALPAADRWELYERMTDERRSPTAHAGRNGRVLFLAQLAHEHGETEADVLAYCEQYAEPGFDLKEIRATVASAVKRTDGGKFSAEKLAHYAAKRDGATKATGGKKDGQQQDEGNPYTRMLRYISKTWEFRFDIVANELEYRPRGGEKWGALNENNLLHELRRRGHKVSDAVLMSLLNSDFVERFDPFLAYFEGLAPYDPAEGSHIDKLASYVRLSNEEKDRDWFNRMFKKTLVRVAAAATLKIPFNKQCFVLKSDQNDGKSTFIRWLCPPALARYRVDWTREEVSEKDGRITLAQNFITNLDELSNFGKQNIEQTKALMSLDSIKERPPYGKRPIRFPRRTSFFGSTNRDEFLTDESGSVRWLVFEIAGIQHDGGGPEGYGKNVSIDRVWAEAWHLLLSGQIEPQMGKEDIAESEARNRAYQVTTSEMETVLAHLVGSAKGEPGAEFMTVTGIANYLQGLTHLRLNKNQVGGAIRLLRWPQVQVYSREKAWQEKGYWVLKSSRNGNDF